VLIEYESFVVRVGGLVGGRVDGFVVGWVCGFSEWGG